MKRLLTVSLFFLAFAGMEVNAQTYTMSNSTVQACGGTFVDVGGAGGNYPNGATIVMTFQATTPGDAVCLDFSQWDIDYSIFGWGEMSFYDGNSTASPLIMTATGDWVVNPGGTAFDFSGPGMVCSTTGDLTVEFNPDGTGAGWQAALSCYSPSLAPGCNITANADTLSICQGDSANLSALGSIINVPLDNNFNGSTIGVGWNSTVNAVFNNPCGAGLDATPHLWMGIEPLPRILTSQTYDVSNGGVISFDFKMATQAQAAPCEGPDEVDEGVYLQYSIDGGVNWITIHYFYPPFYTDGSSHGLNWQNYVFNIPAAAQTTATEFRWIQDDGSSNSTDHWGIDNVQISYPVTSTISWDQGLGLGENHTVFPVATTTYTATITDGVTSCNSSVTITVNPCGCSASVGVLNASTTGNTTNINALVNEFILCDNDHFLVDTVNGYTAATGANPALDYAIYVCAPTPGVEPGNDPCFSGAYIETPPSVDEINNGGINSNIIVYLNGIGQTVTNNTVWIVPQTLSVSALSANQYDPLCYDLGTPYKVTYLNPITTTDVEDCPAGTVVVTISGGYPEFFTGDYNLTNTGLGTLSSATVSTSGGTVTISGLTGGDNYSFTILDDNNCPVTYTGGAFPNCACPADVGNIALTGSGTLVGTNEYDLTDCQTITFTASNEDLNTGALVYGWAIFSCEPTLPFTAAEILDFNNHPCYLGQSTGLSTSDTDAGGISGGIPGGFDTLYVVPYTSEALLSGSLDNNGDGCYDYGDVYQINYIAPTCGDCAAPTCAIGSVPEFANRSYLQCDNPCADLNDLTHVTYHTVTTDAFGNVGVVQQLSFDQILCSGITRSAVLRDAASACTAVDILPTTLNANAVGSGFNPEWIGLTPNTNYTLIMTTVIGSNCNYDFGCIDFYGIPQCVVDVGNTSAVTTDNTNNDYVLCFNEAIDLVTTGYTLPLGYPTATIGYALYNCLPTTNDPATDPCFTGQYVVGDVANSVNDGTFAAALAAPNQTVWLVPITMDTALAPVFDHDFDADGCYEMGTPIEITYLNAIDTIVTQNCGAGEITVQISGGYPEFFTGNYNITNNGAGTLGTTTLAVHNGTITLSGLSNGMGYDLSIVDDNACTITNVTGTYISAIIDSVPVINAGCNNNDGQLEVFASNTFGSVDYSVNGVVQTNNAVFNGLSAGSYFIQVTDASGCIDSLTVTISAALLISFDVNTVSVTCFGDNDGSITFSNAAGGDGAYNYSIDNGATTQTTTSFINLSAATYQVIVSDNSGCQLDSLVIVNSPAAISYNMDSLDVVCFGEANGSITFSNAVGGDGVYNYSIDNGVTNQASPIFNTLGAATYQLTVTDNSGCLLDSTITINEPNPLTFNVDSVDVTCFGELNGSITFSNAAGGDGTYNYSIDNGATNQASPIINTLGAATYQLTVTDNSGCLLDSTITINEPNPITFNVDSVDATCFGELNGSITFSNASGGDGVYNYSIDNGATNQASPIFNTLGAATYQLTVTDNSGCLLDSTIIINQPTILVLDDLTIVDPSCNGSSDGTVTATISGGVTNYIYTWSNTLAGVNDNQATNVGLGTYSLTVTDLNGCSVDTLNFVVNEPAPITVTTITSMDVLCADSCNGTITVVSPNATLFGINGGVLAATNQFTNLCNGFYTLQLTDASGCAFDTTATIGSPDPIVVTADLGLTICIDENVNLSATATGGTGTLIYTWINDLGVVTVSTVSPIVTTIYSVSVTDDNGCPSNIDTQIITVRDSLSVVAFSDTAICKGSSANIQAIASGGDGTYTYTWDNGGGVGTPVNVSPIGTTVYTVTVTDGCSTPAVNDIVIVAVQGFPNTLFTGGDSECDLVNATFTADDINNPAYYNASFQWNFGNGAIENSRDLASYSYTNTGCYDVSYTITDSIGCVSSDTLFDAVCVYENPTADFSYSPQVIDLLNPQVEFEDESTGDNLTYAWSFENSVTPASSSLINPIIYFPAESEATYIACLTVVENNTTCTSSICKEVIIGGVLFFYIPNAFTPNDDGVNETFKPSILGADIEDYTFMIFDRWGELVFESQNLTNGWDGHYKTSEVKQDIYVWKVRFYDPTTNTTIDKVGHVSLIK
jgi:gliding motility-associated-like protein